MKGSGKLHIADQTLIESRAEACELLIYVSEQLVSYAVTDTENKHLCALYSVFNTEGHHENFNELQQVYPYLQLDFKAVKLAVKTRNFTFIPSEYYTEDNLSLYLSFVHSTLPSEITVNPTLNGQITAIASLNKTLIEGLALPYTELKYYSQAEPLIEAAKAVSGEQDTLLLRFNNPVGFEALLLHEGRFKYYNSFDTNTTDDFNYFLLLLIQQLDLKAAGTRVMLSGDIERYDANYQRIKQYFGIVSFAGMKSLYTIPEPFAGVPGHKHLTLLSLGLCE